MALTEQRILKSIEIIQGAQIAQVLWVDQILRNGVVITETNHRGSYNATQKDQFLADVDGAANYIVALGWA